MASVNTDSKERSEESLNDRWRTGLLFGLALCVASVDQVSKVWIRENISIGQSWLEIGFFRVTHVINTGAAFGIFQGQTFLLTVVGLIAVAVIIIYVLVFHRAFPYFNRLLDRAAVGLILGGAAGNLIDRIRLGHVTDFIDFNFWPVFNVADSAVTVGVILLSCSLLAVTIRHRHG